MLYDNGTVKIFKTKYTNVAKTFEENLTELMLLHNIPNEIDNVGDVNSSRIHLLETSKTLFYWEGFQDYLKFLKPHIINYIESINQNIDNYYISYMWSNRYLPNTSMMRHKHPYVYDNEPILKSINNTVSIILYLKKPKNSGNLILEIPNNNSSQDYTIETEEGEVVIFQSSLWHRVSINKSKEDKFTIVIELVLKTIADADSKWESKKTFDEIFK